MLVAKRLNIRPVVEHFEMHVWHERSKTKIAIVTKIVPISIWPSERAPAMHKGSIKATTSVLPSLPHDQGKNERGDQS